MLTLRCLVIASVLSTALAAQTFDPHERISLARVDKAPHPAGDVTGDWKGTVETKGVSIPLYLILTRTGDTYSASIGPTKEQRIPLETVSVTGGVVRFPLGRSGDAALTLKNGRLIGGVLPPGSQPVPPPAPAPVPAPAQVPAPAPTPAPREAPPPPAPPPEPRRVEKPAESAPAVKSPETAAAQLEALADAEFATQKLGSTTVGIVSGPALTWTKSYGLADIEANKPAARDSVYRIGSITKQFTAIMLLQLVQRGTIHLSDPAEKYVPELGKVAKWQPDTPPVTLVELATHTSGLVAEPDDMATYVKGPASRWELIMLSSIPKLKYAFEPGTRYSYSNIAYAILGLAMARAVHQTYMDYVAEHIFKPLGMTHTSFEPDPLMLNHLAKGYVVRDDKADPAEAATELVNGRGYKVPNGGIFTTVEDLARFVSFEMGDGPESVLPRNVWADNLTRTLSATGDLTSAYGVGFRLRRRGGLVIAGHAGSVAGYSAEAYFHAASHTGVIVLRNTAGAGDGMDFVWKAMEALVK